MSQENGRLPWFRFWVQDFIQDEKVQRMNNEAVGLYIKLLILQWTEGSIPEDCVDLASLRLLDTLSHPETHEGGFSPPYAAGQALLDEVISLCFVPHPTLKGRLINPRLNRERLEISKQFEAKREAGRLGGLARSSTATAQLKHHSQHSSSTAQASQSHSHNQKTQKEKKEGIVKGMNSTDADWLVSLQSDPAYLTLDVSNLIAKCRVWCTTNNKPFSKRRVVNWLNRDRPLTTTPTPIRPTARSAADILKAQDAKA